MSEQIKNGGPAFPVFGVNCVRVEMEGSTEREPQQISDGMTLRDYFAAKAMQGMFAADTDESFMLIEEKAAEAYAMADAMLAAREQDEQQA